MEKEGIEILPENIQKNKINSENILSDIRTQHNIQVKSGVEYVDWTQLTYGFCQ